MSEELDTAKRYRMHAEELRTIAADKNAPEIRQILLGIAADYEHMAISREAIDRTNKLLRRVESEHGRKAGAQPRLK